MNIMSRIFITGSSDGIGQAGAKLLADQGHKVFLHARSEARAKEAKDAVPNASGVLVGDISTIAGAKALAAEAKKAGPWDAVIHNAGLGPGAPSRMTEDGFQSTFAVNSLAPYILTCLMDKPKRLLYLSSGLHYSGSGDFKDITWSKRSWSSGQAYNDSKLHDVMLANFVARQWTDVQSCSMDPGWISTKMGGRSAPGQVSTPGKAIFEFALGESGIVGDKSAVYFTPQGAKTAQKPALDTSKQDEFVKICEELSRISFPKSRPLKIAACKK